MESSSCEFKILQELRVLAAAFAVALAASVHAQPADLVDRAETLVRAGRHAEAYQLLEPHEGKLAGNLKYDYLLGRSALETGRASKASFIYERILAVEPNFVGVRLEMGRAYSLLGDYARAKLEFETVLRFEGLPPDIREQAQIYAKAAEDILAGRKTVGFGYVEYGLGRDSNPLSATSTATITLADGSLLQLPASALKRGDSYHALSTGGELIHALSDRVSLYGGGDLRGRWHRDIDSADYQSADARAGVGYSEGPGSYRFGATAGRYRLDNASTRNSFGLTADWRHLLDKQTQLSAGASAIRYRHVPQALKSSDFDNLQLSLGWLRTISEGRGALALNALAGREDATEGRSDGDKPFAGFRVSVQNTLAEKLGGFVLAGWQRGHFSQNNPLFGYRRRDTLYDLTAGLTWTFAQSWSLRPQLVILRNDSNMSLFKYDRSDFSVNLRRDF